MKKYILILLSVLLLSLAACGAFGTDEKLAVVDDGCYYGMSVSKLTSKKGEPTEKITDYCDTPFLAYTYSETVHGLEADVVYLFEDGWLSTALVEAHYTFLNVSYDVALPVAKGIYKSVKGEQGENDGFYETDFTEEASNFSASLALPTALRV